LRSAEQTPCPGNLGRILQFAHRALTLSALFVFSWTFVTAIAAAQETPAPEKPDAAVRTQMRSVHYRFAENIAVQIKYLSGALISTAL
jgi:hypothetical protein